MKWEHLRNVTPAPAGVRTASAQRAVATPRPFESHWQNERLKIRDSAWRYGSSITLALKVTAGLGGIRVRAGIPGPYDPTAQSSASLLRPRICTKEASVAAMRGSAGG